ncbi:MAG: transposase [Candidatus Brocadia sp.]|nr:transposase [Candidatus Brocadia sp.]
MNYDPEKHRRRSIRLKGYDYTRPGAYFVTICTENRVRLFGNISGETMQLNAFGRLVQTHWDDLTHHYPQVKLDAFVIMPNHVHGIIILTEIDKVGAGLKPAPTIKQHGLPEIVRALKTFSARRVNELRNTPGVSLWQRNYYDHIIRNERALNIIRRYILYNPLMWAYDMDNPDRPPLSTEKMKSGMKQKCGFTNNELDFIMDYDIKYRMRHETDDEM